MAADLEVRAGVEFKGLTWSELTWGSGADLV